jgi:SAM-dependent methyltransferase
MINRLYDNLKRHVNFIISFLRFNKLNTNRRFLLLWSNRQPCLGDDTATTGFDRHYVYHTAWAARVLSKMRPAEHVDISSFLYFSALVSAFIPVKFYDYRPVKLNLSGFSSDSADLLHLPFPDNNIKSLSCMHVVEHVGLGRYGDSIDPDGDLKAIAELKRVIAPGGHLLFVVPIGNPKLMFNAHRIYSYEQICQYFSDMELVEFTLISGRDNSTGLILNPPSDFIAQEKYGCGCFLFKKAYYDRT